MPRPGPRPYECIRKAWHSERHQPIRGSLIKEIFRAANEIHSSSTKQNKEWQEKLPTVVLKAEEIIYSKANSEAEYMDLKTLWERTNDAINTIIRRDEGSETGEFLQPCIEAALNLGCTPRRSSRSQRNCHPRCYLSSNVTEIDHVAANCSNLSRPLNRLSSNPRSPTEIDTTTTMKLPTSAPKNVPLRTYEKLVGISNFAPTKSFSAYPLYFGSIPQFETIYQGHILCPKLISDGLEPARGAMVPNVHFQKDCSTKKTDLRDVNIATGHSKIGCDLSLRLGPRTVTVPTPISIGNKQTQGVKDEYSRGGETFSNHMPILDKGISLFRRGNPSNSLGSFNNVEAEATTRKRKGGFDHQ